MSTLVGELCISMKLEVEARWDHGQDGDYTATLDALNILIRDSGDEDSMKKAVEEEIAFLIDDLTKDSWSDLIHFLLAQGVNFTISPIEEEPMPVLPAVVWPTRFPAPTWNERIRIPNMEHHGRVRIAAGA